MINLGKLLLETKARNPQGLPMPFDYRGVLWMVFGLTTYCPAGHPEDWSLMRVLTPNGEKNLITFWLTPEFQPFDGGPGYAEATIAWPMTQGVYHPYELPGSPTLSTAKLVSLGQIAGASWLQQIWVSGDDAAVERAMATGDALGMPKEVAADLTVSGGVQDNHFCASVNHTAEFNLSGIITGIVPSWLVAPYTGLRRTVRSLVLPQPFGLLTPSQLVKGLSVTGTDLEVLSLSSKKSYVRGKNLPDDITLHAAVRVPDFMGLLTRSTGAVASQR